jgi:hypothetical protein
MRTEIHTERNDESKSGFLQFCERAYKVLRYTVRMLQVRTVIFVTS